MSKTKISEPQPTGHEPEVSIVIPSYNSLRTIQHCLDSLFGQKHVYEFELIVIDSSDDGTDRFISSIYPSVKLTHLDHRCSVGRARNIGVTKALADIILFIDSDCIANPRWIEQMVSALIESPFDGICGAMENGTPQSFSGTIGFLLEFYRFLPHPGEPKSAAFLVGGNSGFKKSLLIQSQYPDNNLGDDFTFSSNLQQQGYRLGFVPYASIRHLNKTGLIKVFIYQYKIGKGAVLYRQHSSPELISWFKCLPVLTLLLPFYTIPMIGAAVLLNRNFVNSFTFIVAFPLVLVMHLAWLAGFFFALFNLPIHSRICTAPSISTEGIHANRD